MQFVGMVSWKAVLLRGKRDFNLFGVTNLALYFEREKDLGKVNYQSVFLPRPQYL